MKEGLNGEGRGLSPWTDSCTLVCFRFPHLQTGSSISATPNFHLAPSAACNPQPAPSPSPNSSETKYLPLSSHLPPTTCHHGLSRVLPFNSQRKERLSDGIFLKIGLSAHPEATCLFSCFSFPPQLLGGDVPPSAQGWALLSGGRHPLFPVASHRPPSVHHSPCRISPAPSFPAVSPTVNIPGLSFLTSTPTESVALILNPL